MSEYLLRSLRDYKESRYGAYRYVPGNSSAGVYTDSIDLFYNTTFFHGMSICLSTALVSASSAASLN